MATASAPSKRDDDKDDKKPEKKHEDKKPENKDVAQKPENKDVAQKKSETKNATDDNKDYTTPDGIRWLFIEDEYFGNHWAWTDTANPNDCWHAEEDDDDDDDAQDDAFEGEEDEEHLFY